MLTSSSKVPKIFVSYSRRGPNLEYLFIKQLIVRIASHPLEPWDFEVFGQQIPIGAKITQACVDKIEQAEVFIPVITDKALTSTYVAQEISCALVQAEIKKKYCLAPIIITKQRAWNAPYKQLRVRKCCTFLLDKQEDIPERVEKFISDLCQSLGVEYLPPEQDPPNLPLTRNLNLELEALCRKQSQSKIIFDLNPIWKDCSKFAKRVQKQDYVNAMKSIDKIEDTLNDEDYYPGHKFYYLSIVKAVIHQNLAAEYPYELDKAQKIFHDLIKGIHPELDENAYAGAGNIAMKKGDYSAAFEYHQMALKLCPNSTVCYHNLMLTKLALQQPLERSDIYARLDKLHNGMVTQTPGSIDRMAILLICGLVQCGDIDYAMELWGKLVDIEEDYSDLVLSIAHILFRVAEQTRDRDALFAAEFFIDAFTSKNNEIPDKVKANMLNTKAWVKSYLGDGEGAQMFFNQAIELQSGNLRYHTDSAIQYLESGCYSNARELLEGAIYLDSEEAKKYLESREYQYYLGLAYWLMNDNRAANDCYRRSGEYGSYYEQYNDWVPRISK